MLNRLFEKIEEQQKDNEGNDVFYIGEQLKEICKANPDAIEIVLQDLEIPEMSIKAAAAEMKKAADEIHKKDRKNCVCIPPDMADRIIKKFYGISENSNSQTTANLKETSKKTANFIDLKDFI